MSLLSSINFQLVHAPQAQVFTTLLTVSYVIHICKQILWLITSHSPSLTHLPSKIPGSYHFQNSFYPSTFQACTSGTEQIFRVQDTRISLYIFSPLFSHRRENKYPSPSDPPVRNESMSNHVIIPADTEMTFPRLQHTSFYITEALQVFSQGKEKYIFNESYAKHCAG